MKKFKVLFIYIDYYVNLYFEKKCCFIFFFFLISLKLIV